MFAVAPIRKGGPMGKEDTKFSEPNSAILSITELDPSRPAPAGLRAAGARCHGHRRCAVHARAHRRPRRGLGTGIIDTSLHPNHPMRLFHRPAMPLAWLRV